MLLHKFPEPVGAENPLDAPDFKSTTVVAVLHPFNGKTKASYCADF